MADFFFYLFAFLTVLAAAGVVVNRNAVNAGICLLLSFLGVAVLLVLLDAYFLAARARATPDRRVLLEQFLPVNGYTARGGDAQANLRGVTRPMPVTTTRLMFIA